MFSIIQSYFSIKEWEKIKTSISRLADYDCRLADQFFLLTPEKRISAKEQIVFLDVKASPRPGVGTASIVLLAIVLTVSVRSFSVE